MKKYVVKKVSDKGEDVVTSAAKFDGILEKLLKSEPKTNVDVLAHRVPKADK